MDMDYMNPHVEGPTEFGGIAYEARIPLCDDLTAITLGHLLADMREKIAVLETLASRIGLSPDLAEHLQTQSAKLGEALDDLDCTHCERAAATEMSGLTGRLCARCFVKEPA